MDLKAIGVVLLIFIQGSLSLPNQDYPKFEWVADKGNDGAKDIKVTYPDGTKDYLNLRISRFGGRCNYEGSFASRPIFPVSVTGCENSPTVEISLGPQGAYTLKPNGDVAPILHPFNGPIDSMLQIDPPVPIGSPQIRGRPFRTYPRFEWVTDQNGDGTRDIMVDYPNGRKDFLLLRKSRFGGNCNYEGHFDSRPLYPVSVIGCEGSQAVEISLGEEGAFTLSPSGQVTPIKSPFTDGAIDIALNPEKELEIKRPVSIQQRPFRRYPRFEWVEDRSDDGVQDIMVDYPNGQKDFLNLRRSRFGGDCNYEGNFESRPTFPVSVIGCKNGPVEINLGAEGAFTLTPSGQVEPIKHAFDGSIDIQVDPPVPVTDGTQSETTDSLQIDPPEEVDNGRPLRRYPRFEWVEDRGNDGVRDIMVDYPNGQKDFLNLRKSRFGGDCNYEGNFASRPTFPVAVTGCENSPTVEINLGAEGSFSLTPSGQVEPVKHPFDGEIDIELDPSGEVHARVPPPRIPNRPLRRYPRFEWVEDRGGDGIRDIMIVYPNGLKDFLNLRESRFGGDCNYQGNFMSRPTYPVSVRGCENNPVVEINLGVEGVFTLSPSGQVEAVRRPFDGPSDIQIDPPVPIVGGTQSVKPTDSLQIDPPEKINSGRPLRIYPRFEWVEDRGNDGVRDIMVDYPNGQKDFLNLRKSRFGGDCNYEGNFESKSIFPVSVVGCENDATVEINLGREGAFTLSPSGQVAPIKHPFDGPIDIQVYPPDTVDQQSQEKPLRKYPRFEWIPDRGNDGVRDMKVDYPDGSTDFLLLAPSLFDGAGPCSYVGNLGKKKFVPVAVSGCENSPSVEISLGAGGAFTLSPDGKVTPIKNYDGPLGPLLQIDPPEPFDPFLQIDPPEPIEQRNSKKVDRSARKYLKFEWVPDRGNDGAKDIMVEYPNGKKDFLNLRRSRFGGRCNFEGNYESKSIFPVSVIGCEGDPIVEINLGSAGAFTLSSSGQVAQIPSPFSSGNFDMILQPQKLYQYPPYHNRQQPVIFPGRK